MQEYTISPINLRIAGTKVRKSGFNSLCTVGVPPENEKQGMDRSTLVKSDPSFVFKHTADYVFYMLIDRRVKPVGTDADGVLSIAVNFPANKMLADGKSPYTLLMELYEAFRQNYMRPMADGRFAFVDEYVESTIFEQILQRYTLTDLATRYVPMALEGLTAQLQVPAALMQTFFVDTQYPEFARFKDVEVGEDCLTTPGLETLEIPRPIKYEVWENNHNTGRLIKRSDYYTTRVADTPYEMFRNVSFSIDEIPESGTLKKDGAVIQFNEKMQRVMCTVSSETVTYTLRLLIAGSCTQQEKELIRARIERGEITFKLNSWENINQALLQGGKIRARDVENARITVVPAKVGRFNLYTDVKVDDSRKEYLVVLNVRDEKALGAVAGPTGTAIGAVAAPQQTSSANKPSAGAGHQTSSSSKQTKQKSNTLYIILAAIAGFALAIVFMLLFFGDSDEGVTISQNSTNDTTKVQTATAGTQEKDTTKQEAGQSSIPASTKDSSKTELENNQESKNVDPLSEADKDALRKAELERRAQEELKKPSIDEVKQNIVKMIRSGKGLDVVRRVEGYGDVLGYKERTTVEAVLNPDQYYSKLKSVGINLIKAEVNKKTSIKTWADLIVIQNKIGVITQNKKNQK